MQATVMCLHPHCRHAVCCAQLDSITCTNYMNFSSLPGDSVTALRVFPAAPQHRLWEVQGGALPLCWPMRQNSAECPSTSTLDDSALHRYSPRRPDCASRGGSGCSWAPAASADASEGAPGLGSGSGSSGGNWQTRRDACHRPADSDGGGGPGGGGWSNGSDGAAAGAGAGADCGSPTGTSAWFYGADRRRSAWQQPERLLACWVAAVLLAALAINIAVGEANSRRGQQRRGRAATAAETAAAGIAAAVAASGLPPPQMPPAYPPPPGMRRRPVEPRKSVSAPVQSITSLSPVPAGALYMHAVQTPAPMASLSCLAALPALLFPLPACVQPRCRRQRRRPFAWLRRPACGGSASANSPPCFHRWGPACPPAACCWSCCCCRCCCYLLLPGACFCHGC
jgi:hypothetical protein